MDVVVSEESTSVAATFVVWKNETRDVRKT